MTAASGCRLVLATANPDKAVEILAIISPALPGIELSPRPPEVADVEETGATLLENARLKAAAIVAATGMAAISDDTGLEVEALGGDPGVRTARYAGEHASYAENVAKLLAVLTGTPSAERRARFVTVAVARFPDGYEVVAEGEVKGQIATAARGGGGFGYDPVFIPDEGGGRTFAEMAQHEKDAISHRGRAFRALAPQLRARL